jgi:hypothetical protein
VLVISSFFDSAMESGKWRREIPDQPLSACHRAVKKVRNDLLAESARPNGETAANRGTRRSSTSAAARVHHARRLLTPAGPHECR